MASSVSAFLRRRCRMSRGSLGMIQSFTRSLNSQTKAAAAVLDDPALNYVIVQGSGNSRTAVLNRPSTLNALNTSMGDRLQKLYEGWENDPNVGFVALKWQGFLCWR
ncbi:3-hydroxyisobutyryl-CoA hydrolase-like protein 1, mitochondrial isoform X2 [Apium graveolens]|uniref:3-hydroxyisobutyryl-CoA hydrolase-like protein 1, mitochondrial isoform X2 n=1 Tax=Apium graveolens TaxID=4045 RepID=UPI003D7B0066